MWSSPLLLSFDLNQPLSEDDRALITNKELIAIDQDELAQPADFVAREGDLYYFEKPLSNGEVAIAVTNVGEKTQNFRLDLSRFPLTKGFRAFSRARLPAAHGRRCGERRVRHKRAQPCHSGLSAL